MKIAVTYENGQIFQHFGHTKQFKIYGGCKGNADKAVENFVLGVLDYDPLARCDHHDHDHSHDCGEHDCGSHTCH